MWGSLYWGKTFFGGLYWGPPSGSTPPPVVTTTRTGSDDPGKKKRKNKYDLRVENYQSPANFPRNPIPAVPDTIEAPETESAIDSPAPPKPIGVIVPKSVQRALAPKRVVRRSVMEDPAVQRRVLELQMRIQQERDDEEVLMMLGAFD